MREIPTLNPDIKLEKPPRPNFVEHKETESEKNDVASILKNTNRLARYDKNLGIIFESGAKDKLDEIYQNTDNYFVRAKVKGLTKLSLSDWNIKSKRVLLFYNWQAVSHFLQSSRKEEIKNLLKKKNLSVLNPKDKTSLDDQEINLLFDFYRAAAPGTYYFQERSERVDRNEQAELIDNYDILPAVFQKEPYDYETATEYCFEKINDKYAVIYGPTGEVNTIFQLKPEVEQEISNNQIESGSIEEGHLSDFLYFFQDALENGKPEVLLKYVQIRKSLPQKLTKEFEEKLDLELPKELDREFKNIDEFEDALEKYKKELMHKIGSSENLEKFSWFVDKLQELLDKRRKNAKEKNFGFASEDTRKLDFFKSIIHQDPRNHNYSITYYLYLRKILPFEIVEKFEREFSVKIPEEFKNIDSFQEFMQIKRQKLLGPFDLDGDKLEKMSSWLYEKIDELSQKIKSKKYKPKKVGIDYILAQEGFDKNTMDEKDHEALLLTYNTLIELPFREKIEDEFGIKLADFRVREQVQFVNFLSSKTEKEIEEVKKFLDKASSPEEKTQRVKAFVSLEYGKDFGATLIETEKGKYISKEQFQEIISKYLQLEKTASDFRNSLGKLEFAGPNFINQVYDAILRRSTEILTVAYKIAREGKAETKFYQKDTISSNSMDEVIEALTTYQKSLEIFNALISKDKRYNIQYLSQEITTSEPISYFHFMGKNPKNNQPFHLMIQTRTLGVKNDSMVKGKEYDGEARINFLLVNNPENPENVSENTANPERKGALSFRIDREGKIREGDIIIKNDPSMEEGEVSWEVSGIKEVLGEILSLGNALTLEGRGLAGIENPQYYHCRDSFSKKYGEAKNFAVIVESFKEKLREVYKV